MFCRSRFGSLFAFLLFVGLCENDLFANPADAKPLNVVFILVDDMGWSDLSCYGSDYFESPQIDAFAKTGLRFTQAYAASCVCSPTRAAILTGKDPARLKMTIWHEGAVEGGPFDRPLLPAKSKPNIDREEVTLAECFRMAGYATAHIGKWHLGTAAYYPETQGYDLNVGGTFWGAPATFFYPYTGRWSNNNPELRYVPGLGAGNTGDYLTDKLTDAALTTMRQFADKPFFLSLWYHTVHSPIEGKPEMVQRFTAKPKGQHHQDASYAAMIASLDENVGRILAELDELGLAESTIVVLTSDNGGVDMDVRGHVPTSNWPLRSGKGTLYEGGLRVPLAIRWPGRTSADSICTVPVRSEDFFPTLIAGCEIENTAQENLGDGLNILTWLEKPETPAPDRSFHWHFPHYYPRMTPASAMRKDRWKLIHYYEDDRNELYDLNQDPGETKDLSALQPQLTGMLRTELDRWRSEVDANVPTKNPNYRP
ncbi:MAG: sulfatase [Planctomycetales bacterium]|nr:sulfatase [Planctomycetales bacterium]